MAERKLTGVGFGTPLVSASLSWERVGADDLALGVERRCLVLPGGRLPRVRQVPDPIMLGVHPSSQAGAGGRGLADESLLERVPTYVSRDVDDELRQRLAGSGFIAWSATPPPASRARRSRPSQRCRIMCL